MIPHKIPLINANFWADLRRIRVFICRLCVNQRMGDSRVWMHNIPILNHLLFMWTIWCVFVAHCIVVFIVFLAGKLVVRLSVRSFHRFIVRCSFLISLKQRIWRTLTLYYNFFWCPIRSLLHGDSVVNLKKKTTKQKILSKLIKIVCAAPVICHWKSNRTKIISFET